LNSKAIIFTDDDQLGLLLKKGFESPSLSFRVAINPNDLANSLRSAGNPVVILDLDILTADPAHILASVNEKSPKAKVIILTSKDSFARAEGRAVLGAHQYLKKPVHVEEVQFVLERMGSESSSRDEGNDLGALVRREPLIDFVGSSPEIQAVLKVVEQVAATNSNVMILGESGTGKRLMGKILYGNSPRSVRPFLQLSCVGLSESLIQSQLFGHRESKSSRIDRSESGLLARCEGGTLFIDELGHLPRKTQENLLRFLTGRTLRGEGRRGAASKPDVRLLVASSEPLDQFVRDGRLSRELFHRLNAVQIKIPALRHRKSDIPVLVDQFIRRVARELGLPTPRMSRDALTRLLNYDWPGNVRELESTIRNAVPRVLGEELGLNEIPPFPESAELAQTTPVVPGATIQVIERDAIIRTLQHVGGSTTRAARMLNMSVRKIQYKLKEYRIKAAVMRSETHHAISADKPLPGKQSIFVGGTEPSKRY